MCGALDTRQWTPVQSYKCIIIMLIKRYMRLSLSCSASYLPTNYISMELTYITHNGTRLPLCTEFLVAVVHGNTGHGHVRYLTFIVNGYCYVVGVVDNFVPRRSMMQLLAVVCFVSQTASCIGTIPCSDYDCAIVRKMELLVTLRPTAT